MAKEYIEREAAKRELLSWAVSINHPEYLIKDDALHIIDSIPAADVVEQEQESKPLNGWISVNDKLPRCGESVIVTDGVFVCEAFLSISGKWVRNGIGWIESEITHWQPMPEPPEM